MSQAEFELKGSLFTLSALQMTEYDLNKLSAWLNAKVEQAPGFFYRAPLIINIAALAESVIDFAAVKAVVERHDFIFVGISGGSKAQKEAAKEAGLAVVAHSQDKAGTVKPKVAAKPEKIVEKVVEKTVEKLIEKAVFQPAKVIEHTIRSGQQIYAKDTDLIIKGQVSAGAEVIADGNIHIYGTLRGRAIAGAKGDKTARIYCSNLQAELVSINGNYWLSDSLQEKVWAQAASVRLVDDQLTVEDLK
ncbi:septum site-determining protein MinC [Thalassotalea euphylliae]|uniref:Probable septum site-determining protein MinC n=1 Tax=Thalassotalea euphylliae TaxID=1655234 RepID=A0A3E0U5U9_9GAMM|nr:septum site-determining protein MinC [Thalassotalea euphylliae]REL32094.1 septum site-determining protein MinC [Thalassotalea euphylliae]